MTLGIMDSIVTLSLYDITHNDTVIKLGLYHKIKCLVEHFLIAMLNVITLCIVMLRFILLKVLMVNDIMLSVMFFNCFA